MIFEILDTVYGKVRLELFDGSVYIHSDLNKLTPSTYRVMLNDLLGICKGLVDAGYPELKAIIKKSDKKMNRFMSLIGFDLVGQNSTQNLYLLDTEEIANG